MLRNKYFLYSIAGHLLFLVGAFVYIMEAKIGKKHAILPATYVYSEQKKSVSTPKIIASQHKLALKNSSKKIVETHKFSVASQHFLSQELNVHNENHDKNVLEILHQAIAAKQIYPENSVQLNETGTVKIGFLLAPNGEISAISVLHSSGFSSIDEAARSAVSATSPIQSAGIYLQKPEFFSVDVIFE